MNFTREQVIEGAVKKYGAPVCADMIEDALECETLEEAIDTLVFDTEFWDGTGFFAGRDE